MHGTLLRGRGNTLSLRLIDVVLLAKSQLAVYAPAVAAAIPDSVTDALVRISAGDLTLETAGIFNRIAKLAVVLPALTVALLAGFVFAARDRRRALLSSGIAIAGMGALLIIGVRIARIFVLRGFSDRDARIVASAVHVSNTSWYLKGFSFVQETPFSFRRISNFTCAANRGQPDSPLFLVNHFMTPASAPETARANARSVLEKRLAECERERGQLPNLVAVDFYDLGDVLAVVREANDEGLK